MGKDWSRGLTKETDPRVARAAAGHVGLRYVRRTPFHEHKGKKRGTYRTAPLQWEAQLAYALGLAATDGCLVGDGRHVSFGSEDREQVEAFVRCIGRPDAYIAKDRDREYFRAQLGNVELYRFFAGAGLTPRKSLTLGRLLFPPEYFWHVVRGLIDGDGSVNCYVHRPVKTRYPLRTYERLEVIFHTGSLAHAEWIRYELLGRGIRSALIVDDRLPPKRLSENPMYHVKLGKYAAIKVCLRSTRTPTHHDFRESGSPGTTSTFGTPIHRQPRLVVEPERRAGHTPLSADFVAQMVNSCAGGGVQLTLSGNAGADPLT